MSAEDDTYDPYATGRVKGKRGAKAARETSEERPAGSGDTAPQDAPPSSVNGIAAQQLKAIVERIERLEEEKKAIADDIKDVYGEAKSSGFDTKVLRTIMRLRKQDAAEREEQEAILDLYKMALGMIPEELFPDDAAERARQALAAADEKIRRRQEREAE